MRLIIAFLLVTILSVSSFAHAVDQGEPEHPAIFLTKLGDKKIQLKFLEIPEGKVLVTFRNKEGRIIFKDLIKNGQFTRKSYDLNALDLGKYSVEISIKNHGTLSQFDFSLQTNRALPQYFTKAQVIEKDKVVLLVKTPDDAKKTITVYHQGRKIFEESFTGDSFGKVFVFEKVPSIQDLTFQIKDSNGVGKYITSI